MKRKKKISTIILLITLMLALISGCSPESDPNENALLFDSTAPLPESETSLFTGRIFKEYHWSGPYVNAAKWQRVTDPDVTEARARDFLPNPINKINIDDLEDAVAVEIMIEMWGGHAGTKDMKVKINGNEWIDIPLMEKQEEMFVDPEYYLNFRYPVISIPLDQIKKGENTFEFTCKGDWWGQWCFNWVIFRVNYSPSKNHTRAALSAPAAGSIIGDTATVSIEAPEENMANIKKVDYLGFYYDFDYTGDGVLDDWQYSYFHGEFLNHIGTSTTPPFSVEWDTSWIPDQENPMKIVAMVTDVNDMIYITPVVSDIMLEHPDKSVKLYRPKTVPQKFGARTGGMAFNKVIIEDDLSKAIDAKMVFGAWNADVGNEVGIFQILGDPRNNLIEGRIGRNHDISYEALDLPVELINEGKNYLYVQSNTHEHHIEVMWPGLCAKIRYEK